MKNCRSKKVPNAVARKGALSPWKVSVQPIDLIVR